MRRALIRALRATGLIETADKLVAWNAAREAARENEAYRTANPQRTFPDPALIFEVAGHARLKQFDETGRDHAQKIAALFREAGIPDSPRVLEWGCGPGRILTHMLAAIGDAGASFSGCDIDPRAIAYAQRALKNATCTLIAPLPPTPYGTNAFDAIYGISIFTHLNKDGAEAWTPELARLLSERGCAIVTTHGARASAGLSPADRAAFESGEYVVLGGASVGSRTYVSYFNEKAGRALFDPWFEDVRFTPDDGQGLGQDIWRLRIPRTRA